MDPVSSAALGAACSELFAAIRNISNFIINSKSACKEFKGKIVGLKPKIDDISEKEPEWKSLQSLLQQGLDLVNAMEKLGSLNFYRNYRYGKKILKLEKKINDFMITRGIASMMLDVHKLDVDYSQRFDRLQQMGQHMMDCAYSRMTNNAEFNSLMLQQMKTDQNASGFDAQVPDLPRFVVGLNNVISGVKRIVFEDGVDIVGINGIGGSGKSTLALALCKDAQVKDSFQSNIIFITVSRKPDVKAVLETMWDKLIGRKRPSFQNIEDARQQLQTSLKRRPFKPTLVVLDDVWSRLNLEHLLFEAEGYKTIMTTRRNDTVPIKQSSRVYELPMLERADALSLFCFWAFGQPSLPETKDENFAEVVRQVERECKGLPLALKVIGSSLCGEPYPVWESAKQKLSRAEPISQYHEEALLNCLETSIGVLDDESRQCFLDLGAFPEGRKFRVDVLLDIWVYVRGMEWKDSFAVLFDLAKRNLLNLTSSPRGQSISYNFAYELSFSQHDVMRDLAIHLANQDSRENFKRLSMPKKEDGIPRKWLRQDLSFNAQIVSIHTGTMDQKQWQQIDFPKAEALILFFDASVYYLPPFLQRMPKLKVQLICNYNSKCTIVDGLANIQSLTQIKSVYGETDCSSSLQVLGELGKVIHMPM